MFLTAIQGLHSRKLASQCRPNVALRDATGWELICRLEDAGFEWHRMPSKSADKLAVEPYTRGGERVWFSTGVQLRREYMHALIKSDDIFHMGFVHIYHWHQKGAEYYNRLLAGKAEPIALQDAGDRNRPALELGVEPVLVVPAPAAALDDMPVDEDRF